MSGSILLSDIAAQATLLRVACNTRCDKAGQYQVTTLAARYGAHCSVPELLRRVSTDCLKRQSESQYNHCGIHCPDLPQLVLVVACDRCDRAGRYPLETLIERHGAHYSIPHLLRQLSANCPKRQSQSHYDLCGIHCPDLPKLFPVPQRDASLL